LTRTVLNFDAFPVGSLLCGWLAAFAIAFVFGVRYAVNRGTWRDHAATKAKYHLVRKMRWATLAALLKWGTVAALFTTALVAGLFMRASGR
jgi:hypothetical protein